eukprot:6294642-Amphidinium_carterae.1
MLNQAGGQLQVHRLVDAYSRVSSSCGDLPAMPRSHVQMQITALGPWTLACPTLDMSRQPGWGSG